MNCWGGEIISSWNYFLMYFWCKPVESLFCWKFTNNSDVLCNKSWLFLEVTSSYLFCSVNDEEVRLMLWDTAGQEEFDAITKAYYRGKTSPLGTNITQLPRAADPHPCRHLQGSLLLHRFYCKVSAAFCWHTHTHSWNQVWLKVLRASACCLFSPFFFLTFELWHGEITAKMWPFATRVLHSRSPSVRVSLLHHGQGFISGHRQLEGEGWGRGRRYPHSSSAEQNWPAGRDGRKEVGSTFFLQKKALTLNAKTIIKTCSVVTLQRGGWSFGQKAEAEVLSSFSERGPQRQRGWVAVKANMIE